ncbi:hypothetical protein [Stakelama pacifica]|uniref:hypothetical protein n=1 Tax=Stakelama pacifica TaxID=517720 RepID=UPI00105F8EED|nr:hypothetical protein [Stakelama pacifica]
MTALRPHFGRSPAHTNFPKADIEAILAKWNPIHHCHHRSAENKRLPEARVAPENVIGVEVHQSEYEDSRRADHYLKRM